MAPRGRQRKRANTRMDAALEAMYPFGFPEALVRKTIKELLVVYTEEGWSFIEEASYKVLIETILEKVQEEQQERDNSWQDNQRGGDDTERSVRSVAGPSSGVLVPACSNLEPVDTALQTHEALGFASQTNETGGQDSLPPAEEEGRGWKDNNLDQNSGKKRVDNVVGNDDLNSGGGNFLSPALVICSPLPVDTVVTRRRRPYHGWISSDDDEVDLVELTPAPLPEHIVKLINEMRTINGHTINGKDRRKQRKRRWDVRPEDM